MGRCRPAPRAPPPLKRAATSARRAGNCAVAGAKSCVSPSRRRCWRVRAVRRGCDARRPSPARRPERSRARPRSRSAAMPVPASGAGRRGGRGLASAAGGCRRCGPDRGPSSVLVPGPDRDRPLGVVAQREARDAEVGRLLLDAARVGEHRGGVGLERQEVEVAERVEHVDRCADRRGRAPPSSCASAGGRGRRPGARAATVAERGEHVGQQRAVDERRAVQRHEQVSPRAERRSAPGRVRVAEAALHRHERVDHRVADEVDPLGAIALGAAGSRVPPSEWMNR